MADTTLKTRVLLANRTESEWNTLNPVPKAGEICISTDKNNGLYKVGNGTSTWRNLSYVLSNAYLPSSGGSLSGALTLNANPTSNMQAATKQYVDNIASVTPVLTSGVKLATITINGSSTDIYAPSYTNAEGVSF